MDWKNVNLENFYECSQNILDPYSFDILLLEIECNLTVITEDTVAKLFEESLLQKIIEARKIFRANLKNIVKYSQK